LRPEKSLVIIDGVDECATEQDQKLFLTLIANALARTKIPLRFLICSRPELHIKETFDMRNMKKLTRTVVLDEKFAPNDDIWRYLEDELFRIFSKRHISLLPSDSDIQHLVSKASGQFIYASTVIKFTDDDDCNPRKQLDIIFKLRRVNSSSPYGSTLHSDTFSTARHQVVEGHICTCNCPSPTPSQIHLPTSTN
ncbi:hypothetical protein F5887DRAFT_881973, partial [Amanita rubescens]